MLDKLPPAVRHAALLLVLSLLTWAATGVPGIETLPLPIQTFLSLLVTMLIAYVTPLTKQYGVGAPAPVVDTGAEADRTPPAPGYQPRHGEGDDSEGVGI